MVLWTAGAMLARGGDLGSNFSQQREWRNKLPISDKADERIRTSSRTFWRGNGYVLWALEASGVWSSQAMCSLRASWVVVRHLSLLGSY